MSKATLSIVKFNTYELIEVSIMHPIQACSTLFNLFLLSIILKTNVHHTRYYTLSTITFFDPM
jgi:hypothetical protein